MRSLRGKVALVTGASSGVGRATALALAKEGARVFGAARRQNLLASLVTENPAIRVLAADLTTDVGVRRMTEWLKRDVERLDALVCAAGLNVTRRRLRELSPADWVRVMEANVTATYRVVQSCLPLLREVSGLVVLIGSVSSRWPDGSGVAYQASKAAVLGFANALALEEWEHAIRVTTIMPGMIDTAILDTRPDPPSLEVRKQALTPEDVANACLFVARLAPRVMVAEMVLLPSALQRIGRT